MEINSLPFTQNPIKLIEKVKTLVRQLRSSQNDTLLQQFIVVHMFTLIMGFGSLVINTAYQTV